MATHDGDISWLISYLYSYDIVGIPIMCIFLCQNVYSTLIYLDNLHENIHFQRYQGQCYNSPLENTLVEHWPARLQLERQQGDPNYRLLNIQTFLEATQYPSQDAKQEQLAARQPKECQTNGRYLTQSIAIQGQSVT